MFKEEKSEVQMPGIREHISYERFLFSSETVLVLWHERVPRFSLKSLEYVNVVVNDTDEWFQPRVYTSIAISLFSVAAMNEREDLLFILNLPCAVCPLCVVCETTQDRTQWCGNKRNANKIQTETMQTHGTSSDEMWGAEHRMHRHSWNEI